MQTEVHSFQTGSKRIIDITAEVELFVSGAGSDGVVHVFAPHATAGVALIETGSGTESDLEAALDRVLPREDIYTHRHGSTGHGADHVIPAFVAPSLSIPVVEGRMALGTWQSVVFVDLNRDNPQRNVRFSFLPG
ncbi:MAG: secondary thiamine-phosphate synthase enzyme YjbQ [Actinomycetota bacterium]